jgi:transposase-like protein
MSSSIKSQNSSNLINQTESGSISANTSKSSAIDTQVKAKKKYATRRTFDTAYKLRILSAYNNCESASERGALLRKEGLYLGRIYAWKKQLENSKLTNKNQARKALRIDHLVRENEQLKKKLAHAEAIIDIQKKISDLLGTHILPVESNE